MTRRDEQWLNDNRWHHLILAVVPAAQANQLVLGSSARGAPVQRHSGRMPSGGVGGTTSMRYMSSGGV